MVNNFLKNNLAILFGNVFLVNLSEDGDESKEYIKLLNSNIPKQKLSIDLILTPSLKRIITDSIKNYDFEISKKPKKTTQDEFEFIRKISTILIDDIKSDSNTLIKETFSEHINDNDINELKDIYKDIDVSESFNTTPDQTYKIRKEILENSLEYPKILQQVVGQIVFLFLFSIPLKQKQNLIFYDRHDLPSSHQKHPQYR